MTFTESIARSLHEKIRIDVIYFDFAKAFDTVSHDLILQKLKVQYKIDGTLLKFFANYLEGRKQQVIIDNAVSNSVDVSGCMIIRSTPRLHFGPTFIRSFHKYHLREY